MIEKKESLIYVRVKNDIDVANDTYETSVMLIVSNWVGQYLIIKSDICFDLYF